MNDSQKLGIEQNQTQRLIPMQVAVGRLLEMNVIEVEEEVKRALEELPALEVNEDKEDKPVQQDDDNEDNFAESAEQMQMADYRTDDDIPSYLKKTNNGYYDPDDYIEPVVVAVEGTIIDTLTEQLNEREVTPQQEIIAKYIIGSIDDNGYMSRDMNSIRTDIAYQAGIDVTIEEVREVWKMIRTFDPAGIAAVDLRDCLLLQLQRRIADEQKPSKALLDAKEIIADYFDIFSKKHFQKITSALGITEGELKEALEEIHSLNPKPAGQLASGGLEEGSRHIVPDFNVEVDGDKITLTLMNNIPELRIEATFAEQPDEKQFKGREKSAAATFIRQRRDEAQMFIRALSMRQETLFRVMSGIVTIQRQFFLTGDMSDIKPMVLKDVSELTGDNISVISRATAAKYVSTPYGVFPLKVFFNEKVNDEEDASSHKIIEEIKAIISTESKKKPFSDDAITAMLNKKGYSLARRTVTKYREKVGIPVARLRKEL